MNDIIEALNWRYATKKFNPEKTIIQEQLDIIKESLRLVPSSYGLQPLKFLFIENKEIRTQLIGASYGQRQVADASNLIVICASKKMDPSDVDYYLNNIASTRNVSIDSVQGYGNYMKGTFAPLSQEDIFIWNCKQAYIALGQLLHTCASLRIDATPMEGFKPEEYAKILKMENDDYYPALLCPIGYRSDEDDSQHLTKVRKSHSDLFKTI